MDIREALRKGSDTLVQAGVASALLDVEVLLAHAIRKDRAYLFAHPRQALTGRQSSLYARLLLKRKKRMPVAYLTGHREFYGLDFLVSPAVLIPRPDSELIVELVCEYARACPTTVRIADVGTGSGALAVALAKCNNRVKLTAVDSSSRALSLAMKNAALHGVEKKITFKKNNLLTGMGLFDVIVANLPYLSPAEYLRSLKACPEMKFEPKSALVASDNGLYLIKKLIASAPDHLSTNGALFLEIGSAQARELIAFSRGIFPRHLIETHKDLARRDRVLSIRPT